MKRSLILSLVGTVSMVVHAQSEPTGSADPGTGEQSPYASILPLVESWLEAVPGSQTEYNLAAEIRDELKRMDSDLDEAFKTYWNTPYGSREEAEAMEVIDTKVGDALLQDHLYSIYNPDGPSYDSIGSTRALDQQPVDIDISVPEELVAGESVTIYGKITNNGDVPVWIVNVRTRLTVPQELWGFSTEYPLPLVADFPTTPGLEEQIVRIEAGSSHTVSWSIDREAFKQRIEEARAEQVNADLNRRCRGEDDKDACRELDERTALTADIQDGTLIQLVTSTINRMWSYFFFKPREYQLNADLHVWPVRPFYQAGIVRNLGDSFTITESRMVQFNPPQTVLVIGAIIGGLIGFYLKLFYHGGVRRDLQRGDFYLGILSTILLCVIGTIMLARLGGTDFLVNVQVQDIWGAVLTGFIIQWLGLNYIVAQLTKSSVRDTSGSAQTVTRSDAGALTTGSTTVAAAETVPQTETGAETGVGTAAGAETETPDDPQSARGPATGGELELGQEGPSVSDEDDADRQ